MRLEFHCHTHFSKDCLVTPQQLLAVCQRKKIDRVVITDHNSIDGALAAQALDPERVIVGEEIMTQDGELLAAFLKEWVPPGLPAMETIQRLKDQGAFISVAHPFDRLRGRSWQKGMLEQIHPWVDAIEIFNARCIFPAFNTQAKEFAQDHSLAGTVGSDAHTQAELGLATSLLPPFEDADELRDSLQYARFETRYAGPWVHIGSRYASWRKKKHI